MTTKEALRSDAEVASLVARYRSLADQLTSVICSRVPRSVDRSDLESAALYGLFQAARAWESDRSVTFEAFARHRIRGALLDELRSRDWASRRVRSFARTCQAASDELTATLGRRPTDAEVADRVGVDVAAVEALERDLHRASLRPADTGDPSVAVEPPTATEEDPGEQLVQREEVGYLYDAVDVLPQRLRRVVLGYYVEELPMAVLADELGVTESRISQMRAEAVRLLRATLTGAVDPERVGDLAFGDHIASRALEMTEKVNAKPARSRVDRRLTSVA